jgi:hypothetical protein
MTATPTTSPVASTPVTQDAGLTVGQAVGAS